MTVGLGSSGDLFDNKPTTGSFDCVYANRGCGSYSQEL